MDDDELSRLLYRQFKLWLSRLDDDEPPEANELHATVGLPPCATRGPTIEGDLPPEVQETINNLAGHDPRYRQWATSKTWTDCFYTTKAAARWALAVEAEACFPPAVRDEASALLRRRWRCLKLQADEVEWLVATLKDFDLRDEEPWLRDRMEGGYA